MGLSSRVRWPGRKPVAHDGINYLQSLLASLNALLYHIDRSNLAAGHSLTGTVKNFAHFPTAPQTRLGTFIRSASLRPGSGGPPLVLRDVFRSRRQRA